MPQMTVIMADSLTPMQQAVIIHQPALSHQVHMPCLQSVSYALCCQASISILFDDKGHQFTITPQLGKLGMHTKLFQLC